MLWDPSKEIFTLPIIGWPIAWYGVLFAVGFWVGYQVLYYSYLRWMPQDIKILDWPALFGSLKKGQLPQVWQALSTNDKENLGNAKEAILAALEQCDRKDLERRFGWLAKRKVLAKAFCERLSIYVIIGTLIGARLGHLLFYEPIGDLLRDPSIILRFREGGLASHGGVLGVVLALVLFAKSVKMRLSTVINLLAVPACIAAVFIRVGNFINQEILGVVTRVPWAVVFAHPADGSMPLPRHPVQLYEALGYAMLALVLMRVKRRGAWLFTLLFAFRFCIEFLKEKQCIWMDGAALFTMGQWLSLPCVITGIIWLVLEVRSGAPERVPSG